MTGTSARVLKGLVPAMICVLWTAGCREELPQKVKASCAPNVSAPALAQPLPVAGKKVLLVHSHHADYPWVETITQGIEATLRGTGVELDIFYMDTKRKTNERWKVRAGELAQRRVEEWKPDVVIAVDDNAQQYFATKYVDAGIPFVFCGVDADPSKYGYPASNITGIIERPHLRKTLELAGALHPIRRIAVLSSNDPTSVAAFGFMKEEFLEVEVTEWRLVNDFDEWKKAVERYNNTVDAFVIRSYQTVKVPGSEDRVDPAEVAEWTVQHATIPTMAFHDFEIADGLLLGVVKSGAEYGQKAAGYALEILRGTPIKSLPIIRAKVGLRMINGKTARRLGITLTDKVIEGTQVVGE